MGTLVHLCLCLIHAWLYFFICPFSLGCWIRMGSEKHRQFLKSTCAYLSALLTSPCLTTFSIGFQPSHVGTRPGLFLRLLNTAQLTYPKPLYQLLLSDRILGMTLVPQGKVWNYGIGLTQMWSPTMGYSMTLDTPLTFWAEQHRPAAFLTVRVFSDRIIDLAYELTYPLTCSSPTLKLETTAPMWKIVLHNHLHITYTIFYTFSLTSASLYLYATSILNTCYATFHEHYRYYQARVHDWYQFERLRLRLLKYLTSIACVRMDNQKTLQPIPNTHSTSQIFQSIHRNITIIRLG